MRATANMAGRRPTVGLPACVRENKGLQMHQAGEKYLTALIEVGLTPVILPSLPLHLSPSELLEGVDGVLITGSPSNVHPDKYGGPSVRMGTLLDEQRDASAIPLIRHAVESGLPLLALCRGIQEMNVAFGGTLHQHVHEQPGRLDHREPDHPDLEIRYGVRHQVRFRAGGVLESLTGQSEAEVNSLHSQGIDRLGEGLIAEAEAPDGQIEAVTVENAPGFSLGVQWHPEWKVRQFPVSLSIFEGFADAVRKRIDTAKN